MILISPRKPRKPFVILELTLLIGESNSYSKLFFINFNQFVPHFVMLLNNNFEKSSGTDKGLRLKRIGRFFFLRLLNICNFQLTKNLLTYPSKIYISTQIFDGYVNKMLIIKHILLFICQERNYAWS